MPAESDSLHTMSVQLARLDERMVSMQEQMRVGGQERAVQHSSLITQVGTLATNEAVAHLTLRVERLESNWTWLVRSMIGAPVLAVLGLLGLVKNGSIGK